ncbi:MAG: type II secretion system protein GspL [Pseudomonadota bacterium]
MTKTLWAFLPPEGTAAIAVLLIDAEGRVVSRDALETVNADDVETCIAVVPGVDVALATLAIPQGTAVQMEAAARLMLQDSVAGSKAQDAVAVSGSLDTEETRMVAQFGAGLCADVLERLGAYGFDPDVIVPAAALLPQPQQGCVRTAYFGLDIARTARRAFAAEPEVMDLILEAEGPAEVLEEGAFEDLITSSAQPLLNLRVGDFAKADASTFSLRWLKRSAILLAVAALAWPVLPIVDSVKYERATARLDAQTKEQVRAALPDAPRIVNARAQLRERMASLGLNGGPEDLLAALASAIQAQPGTTVQSLSYEPQQGMTVTVIIGDQTKLDQLIATLEKTGVAAQAQPIRVTRDGPRAQIVLKPSP